MKLIHPVATLFEKSRLAFFLYNLSTQKFVFLNPTCRDLFDIAETNITPALLFDLVHQDDKQLLKEKLSECIDKGFIDSVECRIVKKDTENWLRIDSYIHKEGDEEFIVGHAEDITVYRRYNENMNQHNSKKNAILNILTHDLAGPIGVVSNLTKMIQKETSGLNNDRLEEYVSMIGKISQRSLSMIRNFMDQEFLESENVNLLKKRVELVSTITATVQEYIQTQQHLKLNFVCLANNNKIYVDIDEDKFMQVINNLISNAMKFTPDGGNISIDIQEKAGLVCIAVADNGIGIPDKYHDTLFDKFTSARRTGLKGEHSHGLGMSIIKTIVQWHNGNIWFTSEENKGTTFYIELPA